MGGGTSVDRRADLEVIFREHHDFVARTLHHLGVCPEAVDDGVQVVFLVVHRRLGDFDGRSAIKNWLFGIARRVASDLRRRDQRRAAHLRLVPDHDRAHDDPRLLDRLSASELVRAFLETLDEDKRIVFVLAELEGMTAPEIADALELNVNTVYSRMRKSREMFQRAVDRHRVRLRREHACSR